MRGRDAAVEQAGLGENEAAGAIGREQRAAFVLAAQRGEQRARARSGCSKKRSILAMNGPVTITASAAVRRIDRTIDGDDLTGRGLHRLAVERLDAPLQQ